MGCHCKGTLRSGGGAVSLPTETFSSVGLLGSALTQGRLVSLSPLSNFVVGESAKRICSKGRPVLLKKEKGSFASSHAGHNVLRGVTNGGGNREANSGCGGSSSGLRWDAKAG